MTNLIEELQQIFGTRTFDVADVCTKAEIAVELAQAIDATVLRARYKAGRNKGHFNWNAVSRALRKHPDITLLAHLGYGRFCVRYRAINWEKINRLAILRWQRDEYYEWYRQRKRDEEFARVCRRMS
jgi:hypothetical protein